MIDQGVAPAGKKPVAIWLYTIAFMIFAMVVLGGLTRLTGSGLSMVEWNPIMGAIPPLDHDDWEAAFEAYKAFPEYRLHNTHMELDEFKFIFLMEYSHRLLGRLIGTVFLLPLLFFLAKRWLSGPVIGRFAILFVLGGLQGVVGWYMVKSGLVDIPQVSQYRLVAHLSMAVLVFSFSLWYAFDLLAPPQQDRGVLAQQHRGMQLLLVLTALQMLTGGFVAGLKAGPAHYTWLVPEGLFAGEGLIENLFEQPITVLFIHRTMAIVVAGALLAAVFRFRPALHQPALRLAWLVLGLLVALQVSLGVSLLLMRVPVSLASAHQAVALLVWATLLFIASHTSRARKPD